MTKYNYTLSVWKDNTFVLRKDELITTYIVCLISQTFGPGIIDITHGDKDLIFINTRFTDSTYKQQEAKLRRVIDKVLQPINDFIRYRFTRITVLDTKPNTT